MGRTCAIIYQVCVWEQTIINIGWLHFLDESAAEPFGLVQTLIWTPHFGLSPDWRLAQAQPNCY